MEISSKDRQSLEQFLSFHNSFEFSLKLSLRMSDRNRKLDWKWLRKTGFVK